MKRILFLVFLILSFECSVNAQRKVKNLKSVDAVQSYTSQKKPILMILPSDNWCALRYFMTSYENQGSKVKVPNYAQAFQEDSELGTVVSKIGELLTKLGYSIKDVEQATKALGQRQAEDDVTVAKNTVSLIEESPLDLLKKRVKADILIQIWWKVNKENDGKSVSFTLEAFDTYTSKRIATSTGTSQTSTDAVPSLLEKSIEQHVGDFDKQMVDYYKSMISNGREIVLNIKKWDDWDKDLETDINGENILDIIDGWLNENTVNSNYNLSDASENFANFEQVHIPLQNNDGRAIDARLYVSGLQKFLKSEYDIPSKLMIRGLGEANLILGNQ